MSLLILATLVLLVDGLVYIGLGMCVLFPWVCVNTAWCRQFPSLYLFIFKDYAPLYGGDDGGVGRASEGHCDSDDGGGRPQVGWRMVAYLLILLGICRVVTSFHWGCGYVMLGLVTCLAEIGFLCNELLWYESTRLHRTMAFVLHNVCVSLLYIGTALPHCHT